MRFIRKIFEKSEEQIRGDVRAFVEHMQVRQPRQLIPGANGTTMRLECCGHEQQSRGAEWSGPGCGGDAPRHQGRCLGCRHCGKFTIPQARLWE